MCRPSNVGECAAGWLIGRERSIGGVNVVGSDAVSVGLRLLSCHGALAQHSSADDRTTTSYPTIVSAQQRTRGVAQSCRSLRGKRLLSWADEKPARPIPSGRSSGTSVVRSSPGRGRSEERPRTHRHSFVHIALRVRLPRALLQFCHSDIDVSDA